MSTLSIIAPAREASDWQSLEFRTSRSAVSLLKRWGDATKRRTRMGARRRRVNKEALGISPQTAPADEESGGDGKSKGVLSFSRAKQGDSNWPIVAGFAFVGLVLLVLFKLHVFG